MNNVCICGQDVGYSTREIFGIVDGRNYCSLSCFYLVHPMDYSKLRDDGLNEGLERLRIQHEGLDYE